MERADAIQIIKSRRSVLTEGAYDLKVNSVVEYDGKFIINLSAMSSYHVEQAVSLIKKGDYQGAVNSSLSFSARPSDFIPSKGEYVKVQVEKLTTKNGVTGLFPVALSPIKSIASGRIDIESLLEVEEEETQQTEQTEGPKLIKKGK